MPTKITTHHASILFMTTPSQYMTESEHDSINVRFVMAKIVKDLKNPASVGLVVPTIDDSMKAMVSRRAP